MTSSIMPSMNSDAEEQPIRICWPGCMRRGVPSNGIVFFKSASRYSRPRGKDRGQVSFFEFSYISSVTYLRTGANALRLMRRPVVCWAFLHVAWTWRLVSGDAEFLSHRWARMHTDGIVNQARHSGTVHGLKVWHWHCQCLLLTD